MKKKIISLVFALLFGVSTATFTSCAKTTSDSSSANDSTSISDSASINDSTSTSESNSSGSDSTGNEPAREEGALTDDDGDGIPDWDKMYKAEEIPPEDTSESDKILDEISYFRFTRKSIASSNKKEEYYYLYVSNPGYDITEIEIPAYYRNLPVREVYFMLHDYNQSQKYNIKSIKLARTNDAIDGDLPSKLEKINTEYVGYWSAVIHSENLKMLRFYNLRGVYYNSDTSIDMENTIVFMNPIEKPLVPYDFLGINPKRNKATFVMATLEQMLNPIEEAFPEGYTIGKSEFETWEELNDRATYDETEIRLNSLRLNYRVLDNEMYFYSAQKPTITEYTYRKVTRFWSYSMQIGKKELVEITRAYHAWHYDENGEPVAW